MKNHTYAKQLARFPYCRIYRHFFNRLTENCQIRKQGEGLLYRYMSLFSLVNFRPALRTVHGQRYVIQAGEWVASYSELKERLHLPTYKMLRDALKRLAAINLIEYNDDSLRKIVRLKITCWSKTNTTRTYSAPCPKDTGFFFFPKKQLATLIGSDRCSEADILLDLWLNTYFGILRSLALIFARSCIFPVRIVSLLSVTPDLLIAGMFPRQLCIVY